MSKLYSWTAVAIAVSGCTSYRPEDISGPKVKIEDAFDGVAKGLRKFQTSLSDPQGEGGPLFLGVRTCKVTVQFNISVQATDKGTTGVTIGYAPYISGNANKENTSGANAGNLVTVELDGTDTKICQAAAKPAAAEKPTDTQKPPVKPEQQQSEDAALVAAQKKFKGKPEAQYLDTDSITGKVCLHKKGHVFGFTLNGYPQCSGDI